MTHDNDLIRRGDAIEACRGLDPEGDIAAIPTVAASQTADSAINADSRQRVVVNPLDLSYVMRHAFLSGVVAANEIPAGDPCIGPDLWIAYDPGPNPALARILAALDVQPDPRDAQIARLVEAVKALEIWDAARGYPVPYRVRDPLRAALAAVKGGSHE